MADPNTLAVQPLSATMLSSVARSTTLVTSVRLGQLQRAIVAVSGGGPEFPAAQEPVQDAVAYPATDGVPYYRPLLRVAGREPGRRPGPDVWFLEDDKGVLTLQWTLEVIPLTGGPPGARPLPFTIDSVRMVWEGGQWPFAAPGVEPVEGAADGQPALRVHGAARLQPDEAATIEGAMNHPESACRLEVTLSYDYRVQAPVRPQPSDPRPEGPRPQIPRPDRVVFRPGTLSEETIASRLRPHIFTRFQPQAGTEATPVGELAALRRASISRRIAPELRERLIARRLEDVLVRPRRPLPGGGGEPSGPSEPTQKRQSLVRSVPFVFVPSEEANGPIYRALHDTAELTDDWQQLGDAGWLRDSDFPNTVFRLPDALRLAWDTETAGPRMAPTLYRNNAGDPRVRLLLRLAPWQDPAKVVLTRRGLNLPAARVVTGQVSNSTLHMGGAFPEELTLVGGSGLSIPLAGAELALDISLSFYEFVCQVVTRPEGLSGTVEVVVDTRPPADGGTPGQRTVVLPVSIRLDRVDDLPCTITLPEGVVSPQTATVTNTSGAEITIGGCDVSFLQVDEESVVPVDVYPARCGTAFPVTLPPGGSVDLALELDEDADDVVWNGVLIELMDKRLTATPSDVLHRVHELAPAGASSRDITVSSPVFTGGALPPRWSTLASLEVELTTPAGQVLHTVLSLANPSRTLHVPASLTDLVAGVGGGIPTVSYRVRNNYIDHQGEWTAPQSQSGDEIVVYPNAAETG
ncbi:MAG TPA: hypothetical protein VGJ95_03505 [Pseudonocardiaceae bacterium]|jgi:hypothetical protein